MKSEAVYTDDMKNGLFDEYYDYGPKKMEGYFINNMPSGEFKYYNATGKLERTININSGIIDQQSLAIYNEDSEKIDIHTYLIGTWKAQDNGGSYTLTFTNDHEYSCEIGDAYHCSESGAYNITFNNERVCYDLNRFGVTALSAMPMYNQSKSGSLLYLTKNSFFWKGISNGDNDIFWAGGTIYGFGMPNQGNGITFFRQ